MRGGVCPFCRDTPPKKKKEEKGLSLRFLSFFLTITERCPQKRHSGQVVVILLKISQELPTYLQVDLKDAASKQKIAAFPDQFTQEVSISFAPVFPNVLPYKFSKVHLSVYMDSRSWSRFFGHHLSVFVVVVIFLLYVYQPTFEVLGSKKSTALAFGCQTGRRAPPMAQGCAGFGAEIGKGQVSVHVDSPAEGTETGPKEPRKG